MATDWRKYCHARELWVEAEGVNVSLDTNRKHFVRVTEAEDLIHLNSLVAHPSATSRFEFAALRAWQKNRALSIVSFRVDEKGRMIGEAWIPTAGLTPEEFLLSLQTVATECDRFEFQITGEDNH
jgi:hypothetical protein